MTPEEKAAETERKKLENEKKQLKKDQAKSKAEARKRAKEIAKQEEALNEDKEGNGFVTFLATVFIVLLWLAVVVVVIKLDVGGFGSSVMTPILKDVPVINKILPGASQSLTNDPDSYGGYTSLEEAVNQIAVLEMQLDALQTANTTKDEQITELTAEVTRLKEFEKMQVEFQRIRNQFYEEVIYAEKGPGAEEYKKYYESIDATTAEYLYKQVVAQLEADQEIKNYAEAYSQMKPKQAAGIFEKMVDNDGLKLAAKILNTMNSEDRGKILGVMDAEVAAKLTKIMDPDS
jgi:flagellar motility protein MotE (MotC chaperone)